VVDQEVMTVPEAAEFLRLSQSTVYEMIRRHELPHVRVRRRIIVPRAALQEWLHDNLQTGLQTNPVLVVRQRQRQAA